VDSWLSVAVALEAIVDSWLCARAMGELKDRVAFVGGVTVDMFVTDRAAGPARVTEDVEVIVRVGSRVEFNEHCFILILHA
jgi:hypothetical protein